MAGALEIHWSNLDDLMVSMADLDRQSSSLLRYATETVCDGAGFDYPTCALAAIGQQLPRIAATFTEFHGVYHRRWHDLQDGVLAAASDVAVTDEQVGAVLVAHTDASLVPLQGLFGGDVPGLAPFDSVSDRLSDPDAGETRLRHPSRFDTAADTWDTARDVINAFVGFLNRFGAGMARLDERSLRDYVVYPLAANYEKIGANANACGHFADGMASWAANFRALGGKVDAAIEGRTGTALTVQLDVYSLVMNAVGAVVRSGSVVYDNIAYMSERISVEVEDVLVTMGERLLKLSARIGSKAVPVLGWATLAVDLVEHGLGIVQDLIDDIQECKKLIDECFTLVDEIKAWAEIQAERLHAFHQVLDLVEQLPGVSADGGIAGVNGGVRAVEHSLRDINADFGAPTSPEADDLTGALDQLSELADEPAGDDPVAPAPQVDDDEMLMAPGPPGDFSPPGTDPPTSTPIRI